VILREELIPCHNKSVDVASDFIDGVVFAYFNNDPILIGDLANAVVIYPVL
jgi:hypothetical protein